jgi:rod shape-determining protein MreC
MSDRSEKFLPKLAIFLAISLLIMVVDRLGGWGWLKLGFGVVANPVAGIAYQASLIVKIPLEKLKFVYQGVARIEDLERRVEELAVDQAELESLREENKAMRRLLSAPLPNYWKLVPVQVVGSNSFLTIAANKNIEIKEGMTVVDEAGVLVGRVEKVAGRTAKVMLPVDVNARIPVKLVGARTEGILVGQGGTVEVTEVLQEDRLDQGSVVVTSGRDGGYLPGIVVGEVMGVGGEIAEVYKTAKLEPLTDYTKLKVVFLVEE